MKRLTSCTLTLVLLTILGPLAFAESDKRLHADGKGWRLDRAAIVDKDRPRVLLIGDSILNGYLGEVIKSLEGKAYVDAWVNPHHQSNHLNKLLADVLTQGPYDVVHFNMGLHGWPEGRIKNGTFIPLTKAYVEVLRTKLPQAKLIWASSTPVTAKGKPEELDPAINPIIVEHNRMAAQIMEEMKIPVSDFYTLLEDKRKLAKGDRFHWTKPAYSLLGKTVVASILRELGLEQKIKVETLKSGKYSITQSWPQETDYPRPFLVEIPEKKQEEGSPDTPLPVLMFLHGNGGNATGARNGFLKRYPRIARHYITVFAEGYRKSWNIVSEKSKADDRAFIESIVRKLASHKNVDANQFTIMGSSNGAALANQIAIETKLPNIKNYITSVSPLNTFQHDGTSFKAKGKSNDYSEIAKPLTGARLLNVSGVDDRLVPYEGGPSRVIPAKGGKLPFVSAEQSIFLWAKHMGYEGEKLDRPSKVMGSIEQFSYLDGSVVHFKVNDHGHNAGAALNEELLLDFLQGASR